MATPLEFLLKKSKDNNMSDSYSKYSGLHIGIGYPSSFSGKMRIGGCLP